MWDVGRRGSVSEDIAPSNSMHSSASNRLNLLRSTKTAVCPNRLVNQGDIFQNEYRNIIKHIMHPLDVPGYNKRHVVSEKTSSESILES